MQVLKKKAQAKKLKEIKATEEAHKRSPFKLDAGSARFSGHNEVNFEIIGNRVKKSKLTPKSVRAAISQRSCSSSL